MNPAGGRLGTVALLVPAALIAVLVFVVPLARLLGISFSAPAGPFDAYTHVLGDDIYRQVFGNTLLVAFAVTTIALLIAFPVAFALTRLRGGWRTLVFACVLLPLWISVLVRTFSWMLVLERNGPVNRLLVSSGLVDAPLSLLFNHAGVLIGMVHVLLPYSVLPIYAALVRVDPSLLRASEGLGATAVTTFLRVLLPLSSRGVATAATFTFLLSLGFFVTPALLGGASSMTLSMLIDSFVSDRLDWPLAAAASVVLLAAALAIVAVASRFIRVSNLARVHR
ncbi:MAG: ABC transporter permease [Burkholderiales bacterium]|nr:ABC transporter permease [Burkholderiales bacterium]MCC7114533.1 ABC transporter permease [Burkholderiales bacterium]